MTRLCEVTNLDGIEKWLIQSSDDRRYTVNGGALEFKYFGKPLKILKFTYSYAVSGSNEYGLAGIVQDDSLFYYKDFTKEAAKFRIDSVFWNNMRGEFEFNIPSSVPIIKINHPIFTWFNIGQYWHWFCEDLPCIKAFRDDRFCQYPIYTNKLSTWQKQSLAFFPDIIPRIIEIDSPCVLQSDTIYAVTYPATSYRGQAAKWVGQWLQVNLPYNHKLNRQRLYISRSDAAARNVDNEYEVIAMLLKYGFKPYTLENLSVEQKIDLFASADIVVSPTGAGLTHVHAMQPGTTVIDFNHDFEITEECGWNNIGDSVGLNWHTIVAETTGQSDRPKVKNSHMKVNVDELERLVVRAIN